MNDQRQRLPNRRPQTTFEVEHVASNRVHEFRCSIGFADDGNPGEVFVSSTGKIGTDLDIAARDIAILISFAIQYGAPIDVLAEAVTRGDSGEPQGIAGAVLDAMRVALNQQ